MSANRIWQHQGLKRKTVWEVEYRTNRKLIWRESTDPILRTHLLFLDYINFKPWGHKSSKAKHIKWAPYTSSYPSPLPSKPDHRYKDVSGIVWCFLPSWWKNKSFLSHYSKQTSHGVHRVCMMRQENRHDSLVSPAVVGREAISLRA